MNLDLDKSAWKRVALGDVVRHVTDRVDAETSGLERFLAGEHIPSQDLAIRDWGVIGRDPIGPMFYKRFKPGHVLYVSRRSYLRKTAVPDFEGITGEKTFVLETKDEGVLQQTFLPFVLSSEHFHTYAVANSRGSVNPYINWRELAAYEFDLPPLDEQQRLAELLWATETHRRALVDLAVNLCGEQLRDAGAARGVMLNHLLTEAGSRVAGRPLGDVGEFVRGRRFTKKDYVDQGIPCIHYAHIFTDFDAVTSQTVAFIDEGLRAALRFAEPGDVVMAGTSETADDVCKAVAWLGDESVAVHDDCFIFRHGMDPRFASYLFASAIFQQQKAQYVSESKVVRVSAAHLAQIRVPVPPLDEQIQIADAVDRVTQGGDLVGRERADLSRTYDSLLDAIFGGH